MKRTKTPTFLLELPLSVDRGQAAHLRAHFEAGRCLYNALLGEAMQRLKRMREDTRWEQARDIPRKYKQERSTAFQTLRTAYRFSEYDLHAYATGARTAWIADHSQKKAMMGGLSGAKSASLLSSTGTIPW